nr:Shedu immune nuclease family protein [Brachybacterium muris]
MDLVEGNEVVFARGRQSSRIYVSKTFTARFGADEGHASRYIYKVFDEHDDPDETDWEWETHVVDTTHGGRKQLQLQVARTAGAIRQIKLQRVPTKPDATKLETMLTLNRSQSTVLIDLIKALDSVPPEGGASVRVDEQLLRDVFSDPDTIGRVYAQDPERVKALIRSDASARDVIALQRRREVVNTMREWLEDDSVFDNAAQLAGGPERAWQQLLEANPWILGIGLGGQLLTSWDDQKLEQVTTGSDIKSAGKRTDALLRTNGIVRSMVFAEIKHHRSELLATKPYRSASWAPSNELAGAVVQVQQTVRMAVRALGEYVEDRANDGSRTGTGTFITQPLAYLIVGSLDQMLGDGGGAIDDKVHSFELFRRNVVHPEILTFDELLARAEWHVKLAEDQVQEEEDGDGV